LPAEIGRQFFFQFRQPDSSSEPTSTLRLVTLPDWQGLGLAMILAKNLGAAFKVANYRFRTYPAHPSLIRSFAHQKGDYWSMEKRGGDFSPARSCSSQVGGFGGRPCAVFEYSGQQMDESAARNLLGNAV
jgi:hypothetical protein